MSKEIKNQFKLNVELKKVSGGKIIHGNCHHQGFYINWHTGSPYGNQVGGSTYDCESCTHWIHPDGPCDLD